MSKQRLDLAMVAKQLAQSRSQAENLIKLGRVTVDDQKTIKPGALVSETAQITLTGGDNYVSRAGFKLASAAGKLNLSFEGKTVLDVGSSTGGFTDFALKNGAKKVIAVDVGTDQLHPSLRTDDRIELHEKTDIRSFKLTGDRPDVVVMDVSFISLRQILPSVAKLANTNTQIIAMLKPQFEAGDKHKHKGVIKNDTMRRRIIKDFEAWLKQGFMIVDKVDSEVAGAKGNRERFYLLRTHN